MVIRACHRYFEVPKGDNRFVIYRDGALHFLRSVEEKYDFIFIDLYDTEGMSKVVSKSNFFHLCAQTLNPEGIMVWNMWRTSSAHLIKESIDNLTKVFGKNFVYLPNEESLNYIVLAFKPPLRPYSLDEIMANAKKLKATTYIDFPTMLSHLNYFKGHGHIFQDWEVKENMKDEV